MPAPWVFELIGTWLGLGLEGLGPGLDSSWCQVLIHFSLVTLVTVVTGCQDVSLPWSALIERPLHHTPDTSPRPTWPPPLTSCSTNIRHKSAEKFDEYSIVISKIGERTEKSHLGMEVFALSYFGCEFLNKRGRITVWQL